MLRDRVSLSLLEAVRRLAARGVVPEAGWPDPEVEAPKQAEHGDLATNWALVAAKSAGSNPRALAEALVQELAGDATVARAEVAGPGFVNLVLTEEAVTAARDEAARPSEGLLADPGHFGRPPAPSKPLGFNVEFVSVNPNGPITIGSGRGAAYGSTLCNVLEAAGHGVHREYYINDGVNSEQMRLFAESVRSKVLNHLGLSTNLPAPVYRADYVDVVSRMVSAAGVLRRGTAKMVATNLVLDQFMKLLREGDALESGEPNDAAELATWYKRASDAYYGRGPTSRPKANLPRLVFSFYRIAKSDRRFRDTNTRFRLVLVAAASIAYEQRILGIKRRPTKRDLMLASTLIRMVVNDLRMASISKPKFPLPHAELASHKFRHYAELVASGIASALAPTATDNRFMLQGLPIEWYQGIVQDVMVKAQRRDLEAFGVTFDTWFSEQSLHDSGSVAEWIVDRLVKSSVADEIPVRTKVKFAKGGVMEEVVQEPQTGDAEDPTTTHDHPTTTHDPSTSTHDQSPTLWLRSTLFGDDMDRVLRRRDGRLTYIASDVAYHADKFSRGSKPPLPLGGEGAGGDGDGSEGVRPADRLITVLGPDHHGYIGRLHAVVAAALMAQGDAEPAPGEAAPMTEAETALYGTQERRDACQAALAASRERLTVQIFQLVRFLKDGKPAPMRKRDGNIYALIDLVREIGQKVRPDAPEPERLAAGKDVARFFYLMRHHDTTFDFDLDLAEKQSDENPVFYVQYAHARICGVLRTAAEAGIAAAGGAPGPLHPKERALLLKVADLPNEVRRCAEDFGVNRLATYAIELARTYHHFYDACRVVDPADPATSASRVQTCLAAQSALRGALELLGVSAPERM